MNEILLKYYWSYDEKQHLGHSHPLVEVFFKAFFCLQTRAGVEREGEKHRRYPVKCAGIYVGVHSIAGWLWNIFKIFSGT